MTEHVYELFISDDELPPSAILLGGRPGIALNERVHYVLRRDGSVLWQVGIFYPRYCSSVQAQLVWEEAGVALIGAEDEFYALDIASGEVVLVLRFDSYFNSFVTDLSNSTLYILTGTEVISLDRQLQEQWSTNGLAIDGVVFRSLDDRVLIVDAEMDPPGGWQQVTVDLTTGKELSRQSTPLK